MIMKLYILFGQRKEKYSGEFGIEAFGCMTEYEYDENQEYLHDMKEKIMQDGDIERAEIITLHVSESAITKILRPIECVVWADIEEEI